MEALGIAYVIFYVIIYGLLLLLGVACYIVNAMALSTIAKRRGMEKPWAAWIPVGDGWLMGKLSDDYRTKMNGEYSGRAQDILKQGIAMMIGYAVMLVGALLVVVFAAATAAFAGFMVLVILGYILLIADMIFVIIMAVRYAIRYYKALFDLYRSCMPNMSVPFLLLSIFVNYAMPVCLMICRNRDDGMPLVEYQDETLE